MQQLKLQTQNFWFTLKHKCHSLSCQLSAAAETLTVAILDCLLLHSLSPSDPASGRTAPPHHEPPLKAQKTQHVVKWAQRLRVHEQAKDNKTAFIIQLLLFTIYSHRNLNLVFLSSLLSSGYSKRKQCSYLKDFEWIGALIYVSLLFWERKFAFCSQVVRFFEIIFIWQCCAP